MKKMFSGILFAASAASLCIMGMAADILFLGRNAVSVLATQALSLGAALAVFWLMDVYYPVQRLVGWLKERESVLYHLPLLAGSVCLFFLNQESLTTGVLGICVLLCLWLLEEGCHSMESQIAGSVCILVAYFTMALKCESLGDVFLLLFLFAIVMWRALDRHGMEWSDSLDGKYLLTTFAMTVFLCILLMQTDMLANQWVNTDAAVNGYLAGKDIWLHRRWNQEIPLILHTLEELNDLPFFFYAAARWGLLAVVLMLVPVVLLVFAGQRLCSGKRKPSLLNVGSVLILTLRVLNPLTLFFGYDLGFGEEMLFMGSFWETLMDHLLVMLAVVSLPQAEKLLLLDRKAPDFQKKKTMVLELLPRDMEGLIQLNRYVFNNRDYEAWRLLFADFYHLLKKDLNTLRIMVLNGSEYFDPELKNIYPDFFRYAQDPDYANVPAEARSCCYNNSFMGRARDFCADEWYLHDYIGKQPVLMVPPCYEGIDWDAFRGCNTLQAVSIPNTVVNICGNAFRNCTRLETVEMRAGLRNLGAEAFSNTALKEVILPATVKRIASGAFRNCEKLHTLTIPDGLEADIADDAFEGCTGIVQVHCSERWKQAHPEQWKAITAWADMSREI